MRMSNNNETQADTRDVVSDPRCGSMWVEKMHNPAKNRAKASCRRRGSKDAIWNTRHFTIPIYRKKRSRKWDRPSAKCPARTSGYTYATSLRLQTIWNVRSPCYPSGGMQNIASPIGTKSIFISRVSLNSLPTLVLSCRIFAVTRSYPSSAS